MLVTKKDLKKIKKKYRLSPRELEVIQLLFQGIDSNKEIAKKLGITVGTAKAYVHSIYVKLRVDSKLQAVIMLGDSNQSIYRKRKS
jgi:DNA-binding NarL/FixJ family response regulator